MVSWCHFFVNIEFKNTADRKLMNILVHQCSKSRGKNLLIINWNGQFKCPRLSQEALGWEEHFKLYKESTNAILKNHFWHSSFSITFIFRFISFTNTAVLTPNPSILLRRGWYSHFRVIYPRKPGIITIWISN